MEKIYTVLQRFFFLVLVFSLSNSEAIGQSFANLGSGSAVNGTTTSSPVNNYFRRAVCQFVYTAAELSAAGVPAGATLTQIGWFVTANANQNKPGYTVKLKHVTNTNVASALGTGGWTTVINPFTYPTNWPTNTYQMMSFNNNFTWDGVSNIGVEVCWAQTANWTSTGQCRIYSTTSGYRYSWTDAAGNSCGLTPGTVTTNKPQARFAYLPPVCSGTPNSGTASVNPANGCPNTPVSLSATGLTVSGGITYQWQSGSTSAGPWTNISGATTATHSITPTASTYYRLVTTCTNSGNTASTNAVLFTQNILTPPSVSGTTTLCSAGTTTLTASGAASGEIYEWFSDSLGNNLLHTGASFTTPTLSSSDTFYVRRAIQTAGTLTFTNCGQTGRTGPSQAQCNAAYGAGVVTVNNGIQFWTVPATGTYTIEAAGAGFNGHSFQRGATMRGDFNLTAGTQLKILVGQMGNNFRAGNGGTFVTQTNNTPLVIAGGAGGYMSGSESRNSGQTGTCGMIGSNTSASSGGCGGNGGGGNTNAGGGGGLTGNGTASGNTGGDAFVNGGMGGSSTSAAMGGFGCGGSASSTSGAAGGGGYSGGGRSWSSGNAGGGGSINNGSNQVNVAGNRIGHGQVTITFNQIGCTSAMTPVPVEVIIQPVPTTVPAGNVDLCQGDTLVIRADSAQSYLWSGGQTADSILVTLGGTYQVQTIAGTCTSAVSQPVTVAMQTPPTAPQFVTSSMGNTFCEGTQTTLSVSGGSDGSGATVVWYRDSCSTGTQEGTGVSLSLSPLSTATYYAQRIGTGACSTFATNCAFLALQIDQEPTSPDSISGLASLCEGQSTTLSAFGGSAGSGALFEWGTGTVGSNVIPGAFSDTLTVTPLSNTVYWVRRVGNSTCSNTTQGIDLPVNVNPNPVVSSLNLPFNCEGVPANALANTSVAPVNGASISEVFWDYGDGNSGLGNPSPYFYNSHGLFTVTANVISSHQCTTSASGQITINPKPYIQTFNLPVVCEGQVHQFSETHSLNPFNGAALATYAWDMGDGATSSQSLVTHQYSAPGAYTVSLILQTNQGCTDTATGTAFYHPKPVVNSVSASTACELESTQFAHSTAVALVNGAALDQYFWDFGDGNISTMEQPPHTYASDGFYTYQFIVETNHGCRDTLQGTATVNPKPVLTALVLPDACQGFNNSFSETHILSGFNGAAISSYSWNLGDGTLATLPVFTHSYSTPGAYPVELVITTNHGCSDTLQSVALYNPSPVIASASVSPVCQLAPAQFNQNTSVDSVNGASLVQFSWQFGDGNSAMQQNPQNIYANEGFYAYQLVVETNHGCTDTLEGLATVNPKPFIQSLSIPDVCHGNPHLMIENTSYTGFNDGAIQQYFWDFGDGNTSTNFSAPFHTYSQPGSYPVTFIVTTNHGCADTAQTTAFLNPNPVIQQTTTQDVCFLNPAPFSATASVTSENGAQVVDYIWLYGDGGTMQGASQNYVYSSWGSYTPIVVVQTNHGCSDTAALAIDVFPLPETDFAPDQTCFGEEFQFQNLSTIPDGTVNSFAWDFGDGVGTSSQFEPFYSYNLPGSFLVSLFAESDKGCSSTETKLVAVSPAPFSDFNIELVGAYTLQFSPQFAQPGSFYFWDFGDGFSSPLESPQHTYTQSGSYLVCFTVNDGTCSSQTCVSIQFNMLGQMEITGKADSPLSAYPNPFNDQLNVRWTLPFSQTLTLQLFDMAGKQIRNAQVQAAGGEEQLTLPAEFTQLSSGVYVLQITGESLNQSIRIVKTP